MRYVIELTKIDRRAIIQALENEYKAASIKLSANRAPNGTAKDYHDAACKCEQLSLLLHELCE